MPDCSSTRASRSLLPYLFIENSGIFAMSQNVNLNQAVFLFVWIEFVIIVFTFNNFMSCKEINYTGLNYIKHVS